MIDLAFSPDGSEMFAASHFGGGLTRFRFDSPTDNWAWTESVPMPPLGGLATAHAAVPLPCSLLGDINADGRRDGADVQLFVACVLEADGANCVCADTDDSMIVDEADVPGFVSLLLGL